MNYPPCLKASEGRNPASKIIVHRLCLDEAKRTYRKQVSPSICRRCVNKSKHAPAPVLKITAKPPKTPPITTRILTYTQAVTEWIAAGRPERSDEEVQRIYKEHCESCTWRKRRSNICRGCGCRVAAYGMAVLNKIKMATEHCPRKKW